MKNLAVMFLVVASIGCYAQNEKGQISAGRWLASGIFCYDSESDKRELVTTSESGSSTGKISLYGGYAFADNQVAGLGIGYESTTSTFMTEDPSSTFFTDNTDRSSTFSISPFYRYYQWCSPEFAFVGTAKLPLGFTNSSSERLVNPSDPGEGTTTIDDPSHTSFGVWIVPSFMWMPDENWSVEIGLGRLGFNSSSASEGDDKYSSFEFSGKVDLLSPSFAVGYYF